MNTKEEYVIKIYLSNTNENPFENEIRFLKKLKHVPGVQEFVSCELLNNRWTLFSTPVGSSLDFELIHFGPFPLEKVLNLSQQLILVLKLLHQKYGIFHRDIKPANIIRSNEDQYILIDFGLGCSETDSLEWRTEGCGTPYFMSRLFHSGPYQAEDDMEGFTFTIIFLILGFLPWVPSNETFFTILQMAKHNFYVDNEALFLKIKKYEVDNELLSFLTNIKEKLDHNEKF